MRNDRILMIEDEMMWIELVMHWLKHAGYTNVDYATSGNQAIEKASLTAPDFRQEISASRRHGSRSANHMRAQPVSPSNRQVPTSCQRTARVMSAHCAGFR